MNAHRRITPVPVESTPLSFRSASMSMYKPFSLANECARSRKKVRRARTSTRRPLRVKCGLINAESSAVLALNRFILGLSRRPIDCKLLAHLTKVTRLGSDIFSCVASPFLPPDCKPARHGVVRADRSHYGKPCRNDDEYHPRAPTECRAAHSSLGGNQRPTYSIHVPPR